MRLDELESDLRELLGPSMQIVGESGMVSNGCTAVRRLGYATNLTPETVRGAKQAGVQALITHHDAWDFLYGMKEDCHSALARWGIAHFYAHLPLDASPFGTAASLIQGLGATVGLGIAKNNGYPQGMVGLYQSPISIDSVAERMRGLTGENCRVWQCGPTETCIMGVVPGGGSLTSYVKDAAEAGCQLYITGEQSLYLIQYCMSIGMNLIVGSHTFTELPGVRSLVERLQARHSGLELVQMEESHYESLPNKAAQWKPIRGTTDL